MVPSHGDGGAGDSTPSIDVVGTPVEAIAINRALEGHQRVRRARLAHALFPHIPPL